MTLLLECSFISDDGRYLCRYDDRGGGNRGSRYWGNSGAHEAILDYSQVLLRHHHSGISDILRSKLFSSELILKVN